LFHPIIVDLHENGRLIADLLPKTKIVVTTPELMLALANGYVVTKVYWIYNYEQSTDLFKEYFRDHLKDKLEASGMPKWVDSDLKWREFADYHMDELGIDLERDKMVSNPSRKTGAKLLCNSLWGKFGERFHPFAFKVFKVGADDHILNNLENKWFKGDIDITFRKYNGLKTHVAQVWKNNAVDTVEHRVKNHQGRVNIALASMITAHARCRLWKELNKLGERVLYHDTDSIIYERRPNEYNIPDGRYLGEWECETGGLPITKFVSTGPKCYSYVVRNRDGTVKSSTKVKGITLNAHNSTLVGFEAMKSLVTKSVDEIATKCLSFKYDRQHGTMITKNIIKKFKQVTEKGAIVGDVIYPFGYENFVRQ
jgi:hypothetical protein